ncbi:early nodulin-like protein 3 [Andrographis paniculata]|uniref:early nodulin-like protein 3 n=1 Tax=Andrographis paniculata TaxID=175694 RepID=UPI0021E997BE|nr:early nodulin-like protein 3 [Andrographis paniculata]
MDHFSFLQLNSKALSFLCILCALSAIRRGTAFEFKVGGGAGSWAVPSDPKAAVYNQWAEKNRFQIDDTLLFVYDAGHDSVLHVTNDDYASCNKAAPLEKFIDGHTVFKLNQSGPFYFISGNGDNCRKNQKLVVVVMADRGKHKSDEVVFPPPPAPSLEIPPPSPATTGAVPPSLEIPPPSPATTGAVPPPPAPAPFGEAPPSETTPAPSQESSPPTNTAASSVVDGVGIIAGFIGSTIVLAL